MILVIEHTLLEGSNISELVAFNESGVSFTFLTQKEFDCCEIIGSEEDIKKLRIEFKRNNDNGI